MRNVFPDTSVVKESACNAGYLCYIPGFGRSPGEGKGYPLQYSGLENSMYSPQGHKESFLRWDQTERSRVLTFSVSFTGLVMEELKQLQILPEKDESTAAGTE